MIPSLDPRPRPRSFGSIVALAALTAVLAHGPAGAAPGKTAGGIRFTYPAPNAAAVAWAGDFNNWSTTANPLTRDAGGVWSTVIALPAGEHQYKFVVDGQWFADPENGATAGDRGNSVVTVGPGGDLVAQRTVSNTAYSPKIFLGGRVIGLYQAIYGSRFDRFEVTRPTFDIDLGMNVQVSSALKARLVLNINPENEDVQEYRSRLNFKRGSLLLTRPNFQLLAYDSENIGTWDDPLHLVGSIGVFDHDYGYRRQGVKLTGDWAGFAGEAQFSDNFSQDETNADRYLGYRIDNFPTFQIPETVPPGQPPRFLFETDPIGTALTYFQTARDGAGYALIQDQAAKVSSVDFGDNGRLFGYGDNFEDVFAARLRRAVGPVTLGALGRTDRGFGLGRLVLARPAGDSTIKVLNALYDQQWYGGGFEASWPLRPNLGLHAEVLAGVRRMNFVNGSTEFTYHADSITSTRVQVDRANPTTRSVDGTHQELDRSLRWTLGSRWTFAEGDIALRGAIERETHRYPAFSQEPIAPAGQAPVDHQRFETAEYQRAGYLEAGRDLDNVATTFRLGWDRNWRYYLNREVKTGLDLEWIDFDYDPRTAWEHQLWFPTGNFWLESGQHEVSIDRLTVLGESQVVRLRPRVEVPLLRSRRMTFAWLGTFGGVSLSKQPRYAESIFQLGFDLTPALRLQSDTRWVKYDAPALGLGQGFLSSFNEAVLKIGNEVEVSFGIGVDPRILDPNTNEFAAIGRDVYLNQKNLNGYYAETNFLSLAPVIRAAEQALQNERRLQVEAIVRF